MFSLPFFSRVSHRRNYLILATYELLNLIFEVSYILLAYSQYVENNGLNISFPKNFIPRIYLFNMRIVFISLAHFTVQMHIRHTLASPHQNFLLPLSASADPG